MYERPVQVHEARWGVGSGQSHRTTVLYLAPLSPTISLRPQGLRAVSARCPMPIVAMKLGISIRTYQ